VIILVTLALVQYPSWAFNHVSVPSWNGMYFTQDPTNLQSEGVWKWEGLLVRGSSIPMLIVTVRQRTFSAQFKYLSFSPLTNQQLVVGGQTEGSVATPWPLPSLGGLHISV
jgi:hypothetical protein